MWSIWLITSHIAVLFQFIIIVTVTDAMPEKSPNYKISPKPCSGNMHEGTCMFVWECIRSEGQHIGMCVDTFMFGSCCAHNLTENIILPEPLVYNKPMKQPNKNKNPAAASSNNRPAYTSSSGSTILHRPHGTGTLVIRPSNNQKQPYHKPNYGTLGTSVLPSLSDNTISDQNTSSDITTGTKL